MLASANGFVESYAAYFFFTNTLLCFAYLKFRKHLSEIREFYSKL